VVEQQARAMGDPHPSFVSAALQKPANEYVVNLRGHFECRYACGTVGWHGWGDPWPRYGTQAQLMIGASSHQIVGFRLGPGENKLVALNQARRSNPRFAKFPAVPSTTRCAGRRAKNLPPLALGVQAVAVGQSWCTSGILTSERPDYSGQWRIAFVFKWPVKGHRPLVSREWIVTVGPNGHIVGAQSYRRALPPFA
jgi:hypothetical protein